MKSAPSENYTIRAGSHRTRFCFENGKEPQGLETCFKNWTYFDL